MKPISYNEFMEAYEQFKRDKVEAVISRYSNPNQAALDIGIDKATLSRYLRGYTGLRDETVNRIVGGNIKDMPVLTMNEIRLEELKKRRCEIEEQIAKLEYEMYEV